MYERERDGRREAVVTDIEALVPENHLVRKIEKVMDYEWIYERVAPYYSTAKNARPGTDPVVLVKMVLTDDSWYVVRNIRGCTGFVGPSSKPIPLTDEEVARLGVEQNNVELSYDVGDSVHIIDGPLDGFTGTVEEIDVEKNRVRVMVSMFGRDTPVELELNQAEPAE